MYTVRPPYLLRSYYKEMVWRLSAEQKKLYLTFDDGPIPELTPWVIETLKKYGAHATFFCVGENVKKNPELFQQLLEEGHSVGNHTFNHLNGWKTDTRQYLKNTVQCESIYPFTLFRPPYGKIKKRQLQRIASRYKIIMWDVLSADFDNRISPEQCLDNVIRYTRNGSIVVFHDNLKAKKNLQYTLPRTLEHFGQMGYTFERL